MDSIIDEIKQRLDIVDVISSYIKLEKAGANYRALCPFHSEKKPSFFVSPRLQIFKCFGCGASGDIFSFVMKIEGVEFGDALRILAKKAGVKLSREDPRIRTQRKRLYDICELATRFFEKQLWQGKTGKLAKKYLLDRGISEKSIREWRIGWAPDTWQGLLDFLLSKGYKKEEVIASGLAVQKQEESSSAASDFSSQGSSHVYDRFRGRIIFPIFDLNSQVVGFGGRVFGKEEGKTMAKYMNTPNTILYDKSHILYGLDKAKMAIRENDGCILVEGYTDVILSHQAGVKNVVATSGTALGDYQLKILKRYSDNLITAFDMDIAGNSATKRGIDLAQEKGFNIKVVTMPQGLDPADVASRHPEDWQELVKAKKSIVEFYFENAFSMFDKSTPDGKREISKIILPVIARIQNKIEQSHWIGQLADQLKVSESSIEEELKKYNNPQIEEISEIKTQEKPKKSREEILEERIIGLLFKFPQGIEMIDDSFLDYFPDRLKKIIVELNKYYQKGGRNFIEGIGELELEPSEKDFLNYLILEMEVENILPETDFETELLQSLKELRVLEIKAQLDEIEKQLKEAEANKDSEQIKTLSDKFNQLVKDLANYSV